MALCDAGRSSDPTVAEATEAGKPLYAFAE
jgi:hypothetical protein